MTRPSFRPTAIVAELLELSATARPELLEVHVDALLTSNLRTFVQDLAAAVDRSPEKLGAAFAKACSDLDRLVAWRRLWTQLEQVVESPNVPALVHVCRARVLRTRDEGRRRKLEALLRKLGRVEEHARDRGRIESFIGRPTPASKRREET